MNIRECMEQQGGFVRDVDLPAVIAEDRFCPLIVRCGSGRFTVPAQDCAHFVAIVEKEGSDYIRDISILAGYTPPPARDISRVSVSVAILAADADAAHVKRSREAARPYSGDGSEFGGVWDGHGIVSDALPGF